MLRGQQRECAGNAEGGGDAGATAEPDAAVKVEGFTSVVSQQRGGVARRPHPAAPQQL